MSTAFTAVLESNPDTTFNQFVWRCARAFGVLVEMRDSSLDADVPESFEESSYYRESIARATERIALLEKMTEAQCIAESADSNTKERNSYREACNRIESFNATLESMKAQVLAWSPPAGWEDLKRFMLEQIRDSGSAYQPEPPKAVTPVEWLERQLKVARADLEYSTEQWEKEVQRTLRRNESLRVLRQSVPYESQPKGS